MTMLKLESGGAKAESNGATAAVSAAIGPVANQHVEVPGLGTIAAVRAEIDDVLADMTAFYRNEPDAVMSAVSAHGARLVEISVRISRIEVMRREWKPIREEADRTLAELKSQFSIASRLFAIRQLDYDLSKGQT